MMVICNVLVCFIFFFFKQKTAYEMRISDWSSDVCSSDLIGAFMTGRKIFSDADAALDGILFDGMTIMSGGVGLSGNPEHLIEGLPRKGTNDLTHISIILGADGVGIWDTRKHGQNQKMIYSYRGCKK